MKICNDRKTKEKIQYLRSLPHSSIKRYTEPLCPQMNECNLKSSFGIKTCIIFKDQRCVLPTGTVDYEKWFNWLNFPVIGCYSWVCWCLYNVLNNKPSFSVYFECLLKAYCHSENMQVVPVLNLQTHAFCQAGVLTE